PELRLRLASVRGRLERGGLGHLPPRGIRRPARRRHRRPGSLHSGAHPAALSQARIPAGAIPERRGTLRPRHHDPALSDPHRDAAGRGGGATRAPELGKRCLSRLHPEISIPGRKGCLVLGPAQLGLRYGVANSAGMLADSEAISLVRAAIAGGIRTIDTARAYGDAERRIGLALQPGSPSTTIVTKLDPF